MANPRTVRSTYRKAFPYEHYQPDDYSPYDKDLLLSHGRGDHNTNTGRDNRT